ncbi:Eco57I restriction-modification methylase domain-containing protein, partial [Cylindrospermopsis raciborskii]|uniref:Eco57I restriction-modification methylase domain-containing protein n=1 Tax=Cylindrospermopsis raciborskii TaxID=77022 RepID=UPI0038D19478
MGTSQKSTTTGIQIQGNLLTQDISKEILEAKIKGQAAPEFGLSKNQKLEDEIAIAWGAIKANWMAFKRQVERLKTNEVGTKLTTEMLAIPLLRTIGYAPIPNPIHENIDGVIYSISHRATPPEIKESTIQYAPLHIIGYGLGLEDRVQKGKSRLSAHGLLQEYLNKTEHLWGITTNGLQWRLLRDSSLLTRLSYVEFNLEQIIDSENFAEFSLFYRLFHCSRLPERPESPHECLLEFYYQQGLERGGRVRERLRDGVESAIKMLGNGFLQHPKNHKLRAKVGEGSLLSESKELYRQLLRLIYRLLFLMVAESRRLLLIAEDSPQGKIYNRYYSIQRLRELAEIPRYRREGFMDMWEGLKVTFSLFDENWHGKKLGLSPLNGDLFGSESLTDLNGAAIDNYDVLMAIKFLSLYEDEKQTRRVNYAGLDVEELGSVYESLLDFQPVIRVESNKYSFNLIWGSERKTTGSYYTPPELVQQLIKISLEPVINERIREQGDKEAKLLQLKIVDPACGSGHFLLAAARKIGKELAKVRTGDLQPGAEDLRSATRDVIQNSIYGVDLNPLAVDLCKVALWIEGFCSGKPLNFLDHRIKSGNSLVGVLDMEDLNEGIPEGAFKALTGDDKKLATQLKKRNKREEEDGDGKLLTSNLAVNLEIKREEYTENALEIGEVADSTPQAIKEKEKKYHQLRAEASWKNDFCACNLWTSAFFIHISEQNQDILPTNRVMMEVLSGNLGNEKMIQQANKLGNNHSFFHWQLEFAEVFKNGGFDCVLGNPPWERIKLQEKEFFESRSLEIAQAQNKAARERLIKELPKNNPQLAQAFESAKHDAEAQSKFIRESGRFNLTAVGDINTYAVFAETTTQLINNNGMVGIIVPTGIATDDTCKKFFGGLIKKQNLVSLYDFENRQAIFPSVHRSYKFCLMGISKKEKKRAKVGFFLTQVKQIEAENRVFELAPEDIKLMNPNTLTCPVFRTTKDAELTKKIYEQVPVLENEGEGKNPWGISFMAMFHMANDSGLFKNESGEDLVPLYEAKMFHQFDHRWATYTSSDKTQDSTEQKKADISYSVNPRYWVPKQAVDQKLQGTWNKDWLLSFRGICRATDERTAIFGLLPKVAVGHSAPLIILKASKVNLISCFLANVNSLVFDFITRQKVGGSNMSFFM